MATITLTRRPAIRTPFVPAISRQAEQLRARMQRLFEEPFGAFFPEAMTFEPFAKNVGWNPATEVNETPTEYTVTAELPGIMPKDVQISFEDGMLSISGEKLEERKEDGAQPQVYERSYGTFQRAFAFPLTVVDDKITAELNNGVLMVHLPKAEKAAPQARKIEITAK